MANIKGNVRIWILSTGMFLQFVEKGYDLRCHTCKDYFSLGDVIVTKPRASAKCARRCLQCAINKKLLTANVIEA